MCMHVLVPVFSQKERKQNANIVVAICLFRFMFDFDANDFQQVATAFHRPLFFPFCPRGNSRDEI